MGAAKTLFGRSFVVVGWGQWVELVNGQFRLGLKKKAATLCQLSKMPYISYILHLKVAFVILQAQLVDE